MNVFEKKWPMQFIRFCLVGLVGVTFNYSIFFILLYFFNVYYLASSAAGFILGIFLAFFLNKRFTFNISGRDKTKTMLIKYFGVCTFSLFLGIIFLRIFVEILGINVYLANFFVLGITATSNFTGSKLFAFKVNK